MILNKVKSKTIQDLVGQLRNKGINVSISKSRANLFKNVHKTQNYINKGMIVNLHN